MGEEREKAPHDDRRQFERTQRQRNESSAFNDTDASQYGIWLNMRASMIQSMVPSMIFRISFLGLLIIQRIIRFFD
jgi:hypothetical protein